MNGFSPYVQNLGGLYDGTINFLTHPLKNDIPVWKLFLILVLLLVAAYWLLDNTNLIVKALKEGI